MYKYYDSTHTGAPQLNTTAAGSLVNILDACLVGTSGTAYGSTASLGWTLAYSATNQRSYRLGAGTQFYLHVNDTTAGAGVMTNLRGYEAMSDITTGTFPFPTVAQATVASYGVCRGSGNVTGRRWAIFGNNKDFYMFIDYNDAGNTSSFPNQLEYIHFGDFESRVAGDNFCCAIQANTSTSSFGAVPAGNGNTSTTVGFYVARDHTGNTAGSVASAKFVNPGSFHGTAPSISSPAWNYGSSLVLAKEHIAHTVSSVKIFRGKIPGIYRVCNGFTAVPKSFIKATTISGKDVMLMVAYNNMPIAIDITPV